MWLILPGVVNFPYLKPPAVYVEIICLHGSFKFFSQLRNLPWFQHLFHVLPLDLKNLQLTRRKTPLLALEKLLAPWCKIFIYGLAVKLMTKILLRLYNAFRNDVNNFCHLHSNFPLDLWWFSL